MFLKPDNQMPDMFEYIKKEKQNIGQKIELYGLDCGFSGRVYKFFSLPKVQILPNLLKSPAAFNMYELTALLVGNVHEENNNKVQTVWRFWELTAFCHLRQSWKLTVFLIIKFTNIYLELSLLQKYNVFRVLWQNHQF